MHYVEKGDKTKPLMLFVHGFPEFWYSWRYQLKEFSKDYRTIAIDLRGYGESDKPNKISEYHIDKIVEDIRQLVLKLGNNLFDSFNLMFYNMTFQIVINSYWWLMIMEVLCHRSLY